MKDIVSESNVFRCVRFPPPPNRARRLLRDRAERAPPSRPTDALPCRLLILFPSISAFIPLLRERLNVLNPYVRQFLVRARPPPGSHLGSRHPLV